MQKILRKNTSLKILGHRWRTGGYWLPEPGKLEKLLGSSPLELARMNRAALYGLLNFYREYVPHFAEVTEPIRRLLGNDARPWTDAATLAVQEVVALILNGVEWLAFDRARELRVESRVSSLGLAIVMLQRNPWRPK